MNSLEKEFRYISKGISSGTKNTLSKEEILNKKQ